MCLALGDVGEQQADAKNDEDHRGKGDQGELPAVDKRDDDGCNHCCVELDENTQHLGNTEL